MTSSVMRHRWRVLLFTVISLTHLSEKGKKWLKQDDLLCRHRYQTVSLTQRSNPRGTRSQPASLSGAALARLAAQIKVTCRSAQMLDAVIIRTLSNGGSSLHRLQMLTVYLNDFAAPPWPDRTDVIFRVERTSLITSRVTKHKISLEDNPGIIVSSDDTFLKLFSSLHMQHVKGHMVGGDEFRGCADARCSGSGRLQQILPSRSWPEDRGGKGKEIKDKRQEGGALIQFSLNGRRVVLHSSTIFIWNQQVHFTMIQIKRFPVIRSPLWFTFPRVSSHSFTFTIKSDDTRFPITLDLTDVEIHE